jgi:hypothetical protein
MKEINENENSYYNFFEKCACFCKILILIFSMFKFGYIVGPVVFYLISYLYHYLIPKYLFGLEVMETKALPYIGSKPNERYNLIAASLYDENFETEKLKKFFLERLITKHKKFQYKLTYHLFNYYWKKVPLEIVIKEAVEISSTIVNHEYFESKIESELNKHIDLQNSLPYKIILVPFSEQKDGKAGGCIFKFDHIFSDGLHMVNAFTIIADNYTENLFHPMLKRRPPWYNSLFGLLMFPFYGTQVFLNAKKQGKDQVPLRNNKPSSDITKIKISKEFDLKIFDQIKKEYKLTFNELIMSVISLGIKMLIIEQNNKEHLLAKEIKCASVIGIKGIPKHFSDLEVCNDTQGFLLHLPLIDTLSKENCILISKELRKLITNAGIANAARNIVSIYSNFFPLNKLRELTNQYRFNIDMLCSNLPGPVEPLIYGGMKVIESFALTSCAQVKSCIPIYSYNKKFRIIYCGNAALDFHPRELIKHIENIIYNISKLKNE